MNVDPILHLMPKDQLDRVLSQEWCDIDTEFLGFTEIYKNISMIVPLHWTVIDFGCAYAPQSHLFSNHKKYVGVDIGDRERFSAVNTVHYVMPILDFISTKISEFNKDQTFAICSYVPDWHGKNCSAVRKEFKNCFCFYPSGDRLQMPKQISVDSLNHSANIT